MFDAEGIERHLAALGRDDHIQGDGAILPAPLHDVARLNVDVDAGCEREGASDHGDSPSAGGPRKPPEILRQVRRRRGCRRYVAGTARYLLDPSCGRKFRIQFHAIPLTLWE